MLKVESPMRFVRELKGAPLSVVMLLTLIRTGLSNGAICNGTGYSDKSVSSALSYLEEIGMVARSSAGWKMVEGIQLALPMGEGEAVEEPACDEVVEEPEKIEEVEVDKNCGSRRNSVSFKLVNSINSNNIKDLSTSNLINADESENFRILENLEVMKRCGIKITRKTEGLARDGQVDALYILAHVEQVRREGQQLGLAIWRMAEGYERPLWRMQNGHLEGCECNYCKYSLDGAGLMDDEEEWEWWENEGKKAGNS
jgi:hypothetical protein